MPEETNRKPPSPHPVSTSPRETDSSGDTDFEELLRAHEQKEMGDRPVPPLNAAWFLAPLLVSPFTNRVGILALFPLLCVLVGLPLSLVPGTAKIRSAALCAFLGGLLGWILCGGRFLGFQI